MASPATDLVGLNAFAEHMSELEQELIASVFNKHGDLTAEAKKFLGDIKQLLPDWHKVWEGVKANPKATAIAILSIPEKLHDGAATIAHDLGKRGAQ